LPEIHLAAYKAAATEEQDYYRSLPLPILGRVLPCKPRGLILFSLEIATACSAGRILMHDVA